MLATPLPSFEGISIDSTLSTLNRPIMEKQNPIKPTSQSISLTSDERDRFTALFNSCHPLNGYISGIPL